jgi:DNA processing protein
LSDIVVIVESSLHSGTHYTAARAEEQGKTIYAVPGDISRPMSEGCHYLIQTCNCNICTSVDDLLIGLHLRPNSDKKAEKFSVDYSGCTPIQLKIIACLRAKIHEPVEMAKYLECDISAITSNLTLLQIRGLIKLKDGSWILA